VTVRSAAAAAVVAMLVSGAAAPRISAATAVRKPVTHTVTIDGARFSPADLTVKAGDTIVWVNKDILAHTATSTDGAFDSKVIRPGQRWKYVVKRKGNFAYTCSFHSMDAILKVQ
jgi:plastocyanin